jgi:hypothetical protein
MNGNIITMLVGVVIEPITVSNHEVSIINRNQINNNDKEDIPYCVKVFLCIFITLSGLAMICVLGAGFIIGNKDKGWNGWNG